MTGKSLTSGANKAQRAAPLFPSQGRPRLLSCPLCEKAKIAVPQDSQSCPACKGRGVVANPLTRKMEACPVCSGCGQVEADYDYQLYTYPVQVTLTALQANFPGSFQIDVDADFKAYQIVSQSTGTYRILMQEPGKGNRLWMPVPIDARNFAGTAQLPAYLYVPYLMRRQQLFQFLFTDTSGASNSIDFGFVGFKLWPKH
jgi:hypothetical protein